MYNAFDINTLIHTLFSDEKLFSATYETDAQFLLARAFPQDIAYADDYINECRVLILPAMNSATFGDDTTTEQTFARCFERATGGGGTSNTISDLSTLLLTTFEDSENTLEAKKTALLNALESIATSSGSSTATNTHTYAESLIETISTAATLPELNNFISSLPKFGLLEELNQVLQRGTAAKLLFPFHRGSGHWYTAEILLIHADEDNSDIQALAYLHDPLGGGEFSEEEFTIIRDTLTENLGSGSQTVNFDLDAANHFNQPRLQKQHGQFSGIVVIQDILDRTMGSTLHAETPLTQTQIDNLFAQQLTYIQSAHFKGEKAASHFIERHPTIDTIPDPLPTAAPEKMLELLDRYTNTVTALDNLEQQLAEDLEAEYAKLKTCQCCGSCMCACYKTTTAEGVKTTVERLTKKYEQDAKKLNNEKMHLLAKLSGDQSIGDTNTLISKVSVFGSPRELLREHQGFLKDRQNRRVQQDQNDRGNNYAALAISFLVTLIQIGQLIADPRLPPGKKDAVNGVFNGLILLFAAIATLTSGIFATKNNYQQHRINDIERLLAEIDETLAAQYGVTLSNSATREKEKREPEAMSARIAAINAEREKIAGLLGASPSGSASQPAAPTATDTASTPTP